MAIDSPRSIALTSDDAHLFLATLTGPPTLDSALVAISNTTDVVVDVDSPLTDFTLDVVVTGDDRHVYVTAFDRIRAYAWDPIAEVLGFVDSVDAVPPAAGISELRNVVVSPDDRHVIGVANVGNTFSIFARKAATGELFLAQNVLQGVGGINGLTGAFDAAFTPDGRYLLVVGDDAAGTVALFVPEPSGIVPMLVGVITLLGLNGRRRRQCQ